MKLQEEFVRFLRELPKDHREFKEYFITKEKNIETFKSFADKNQLAEEFKSLEDYNIIKDNIRGLEAYLKSPYYEYPDFDLLGVNNYGCSGV